MISQHTPGPWKVIKDRRKKITVQSYNHNFCTIEGLIPRDEVMSNARLIAAAPDLLAACQAWLAEMNEKCIILGWESVEQYQSSVHPDEAYSLIRAAISKATQP